jgi:hypothetical protein
MFLNLAYLLPRLVRHFMPDTVVRMLLRRGLIIKPGAETRTPAQAVERYLADLDQFGVDWRSKTVLILGYGGRFDVACRLLQHGVGHVTLVEKTAFPTGNDNRSLLPEFGDYLFVDGGQIKPQPAFISLLHHDIRSLASGGLVQPADILLSVSVFEHLDDVEGIIRALARLTAPGGVNLHYIDLRDHFFKYPFEMLCYSQTAWQRWLDPTSHLNRLRLPDYERLLKRHFSQVSIEITARDPVAFNAARPRIHPAFLSGDDQVDSTTLLKAWARP